MAEPIFTTPMTFTGVLVSVAQMNEQISQNVQYVYGPRAYYPAQIDYVNATAETTLLTHTVNASDLGTNRMLRATLLCDYLQNSGIATNLELKVSFGGTTLWNDTISMANSATREDVFMQLCLGMGNATNVQFLAGQIGFTSTQPTVGRGRWNAGTMAAIGGTGTVAIDTTANATFAVSAAHGQAHVSVSFRKHYAVVELI